ncbi:alpha/beta hydrolase [Candidatus Parcubacteria bacterium]|nr:alpha/beta hydrolase [Candidatus Parcubacteria bacterium]
MPICQDTIIILHGWGSSKEKWQTVKSLLNQYYENGSRSIKIKVMDVPGFKKETELPRVWDLNDYVRWFEKFCSDFDEPFFLLGHSFGGRVAIKFAARNPEKLKGLILVSSAGIIPKRKFVRVCVSKIAKFGKIFSSIPLYNLFRKGFYKYILRRTDYIQAEKSLYLKETFRNIIKEDLRKYFSKIKIPCLIIWGDKDNMTPISDAYLMDKEIPNSKLEILPGIGHFPYTENPEILAQKIRKFVIRNS